ncbi:MAG: glycosyltransferase family 87 protein [Candidatus Omnitrophota bacterium]|nr:glycosyltransferase family 87 protein [Candidatus Omnitrophota bacterium]
MDIKNNSRFKHTAAPIFLWLVLSFSILQYIYSVAKLPFRAVFEDFGHFYYYSRALEGFERQKDAATPEQIFYTLLGEAVNPPYKDQNYRQEFPHAWGSAVHSPIFYILLRPLTHLKYFPAAVLWLFFNQILLALAILFCILGCPRKRVSLVEFTAVIFMVANFLPLQMNNLLGQTSIIIFFLISWAFYNFERKKDILSGLSLGLAVLFRWYPALLIIYFVFKRQFRVVFGSLLTVAIGFAISIWRLGLPLHIIQMKYMPSWYFQYTASAMNNLSLSGFFYRLLVRTVAIKLPYPHNLANTKFIFTRGIIDNHFLANFMVLLFSLISSPVI